MGVFFQKRGALGKAHAERGSIIAPATHRPPSFSLLKKDPHAQTLRHFQRAKVLRFLNVELQIC
jgi:hypothetical protein